MADIELVIKIDEKDFAIMKHNIAVNNPLCPLSQEEMVSKVANGIPLDKIRAEIEQKAKDYGKFDDYRNERGQKGEPMNDLKRCPFCGNIAKLDFADKTFSYTDKHGEPKETGFYYTVKCINEICGCRIGIYEEAEMAIEAWNRRVIAHTTEQI